MLRVITANLNGIRSAAKKGFFEWFGEQKADVLCVQEIKCSQDDMTPEFLAPHDFTGYFQHAVKKGYSGAGVYSRHEPDEVIIGFGSEEFDPEGRYVETRFGSCMAVLQQVTSCRGAMNGLLAVVLEDHIRTHLVDAEPDDEHG
ncbi:metal-sensing transcriptional repressor, partial [Paraburkholderia sp. BR14262]|uniref:metal-sensing transcriptional repressor n=1 Tax=Paraburkholderia sp. BR14262 TaxID=3236999 RepID=UPI0034CEE081